MQYAVVIARSAERDLGRVTPDTRQRLQRKILLLSDNPRPRGVKKLEPYDLYRVRVGDYRVVYRIDEKPKSVTLLAVGHRREIYR